MNNNQCGTSGCNCECHKGCSISWGAVLAGAFVAVGLSFLFHLLTLGIGLSSVTTSERGMEALAFGVLIWALVGGYLVFFCSGWIAGALGRSCCTHPCQGLIYGFLVWVLAMLISATMMTKITESTSAMAKGNSVITIMSENNNSNTNATTSTNVQNPAAKKNNPEEEAAMENQAKEMIHTTGIASLATFFLFLVGALGASFGGYYGARGCRNKAKESM